MTLSADTTFSTPGNAEIGGTLKSSSNLIVPKTSGVGIQVDTATPTFGWRDIIGDINPKSSGVGAPTRTTYNGGTLSGMAFIANDVTELVYHIPHDYVPGTDLYFHVHWSHNGTTITGNAVFDLFYSYSKGHNQADFPAEKDLTITYATVDIATTPRYRHRVDEVAMTAANATATLTANSLIEVDGLVICTLKLTTLPTIGGGGKLFVHTCDVHYQSSNMATKGKAPNFYA